MMGLCDTLAETIIKRNINGKSVDQQYNIKIIDISESGVLFDISDPIFIKLLNVNSDMAIEIKFLDKYILKFLSLKCIFATL